MAGYSTPHYGSRSSRSTPLPPYSSTTSAATSMREYSTHKSLEDELAASRREQQVLQIQLRVANEENERTIARLRGDLHQHMSHHRGEGSTETKELMQENLSKGMEIERLQHACEKLEDQVTYLRGECRALSEGKDLLNVQMNDERARCQAAQADLQAAQLEIQRLTGKNSSLEASVHGNNTSSAAKAKGLERSLAIAEDECRELATSYKRLQQQHDQALADYRTLKVEMDRISRQSRQTHDEHQHEKQRLQARISQLTHETQTFDSHSRAQLETTIDELRGSVRRAERENAQQAASYRALQSENAQLHELLKQAETELQHAREAFAREKQTFEQEVHHHLDQIEHHRKLVGDKLAEKDAQIASLQEDKNSIVKQHHSVVESYLKSFGRLQAQMHDVTTVATGLAGQISQIGADHEAMKIGIDHTSASMWQQMLAWKEDAESSYRNVVGEISRLRGIDHEMEKQQLEYSSLSDEYRAVKQKVSALDTAIKQMSASLQDSDERYQEAQEHHQALLQQSDKTLAETRQQLQESKQRNSLLQSDLEKAVAQATELQQRIMEKQNELTNQQASEGTKNLHYQQQIAKVTAEMTAVQRQLFEVTATRDKLQQQLLSSEKARAQEKQKFQAHMQRNQQETETMSAAMKHTKDGTKSLTNTLHKYHQQLAQTQALVQSLTRKKAELEKENRALKAETAVYLHEFTVPKTSMRRDELEFVTPGISRNSFGSEGSMESVRRPRNHSNGELTHSGNGVDETLQPDLPARSSSALPTPSFMRASLESLDFADPDDDGHGGGQAAHDTNSILSSSSNKLANLSQWLKQPEHEGPDLVLTLDALAS